MREFERKKEKLLTAQSFIRAFFIFIQFHMYNFYVIDLWKMSRTIMSMLGIDDDIKRCINDTFNQFKNVSEARVSVSGEGNIILSHYECKQTSEHTMTRKVEERLNYAN